MSYLSWIDDKDLINAVSKLLEVANTAQLKAKKSFQKNVIDPFSAVFQIAGFGIDYNTWEIGEQTRQSQKTLQNHVGDFHQIVLGSVKDWENLTTGNVMDLLSKKRKIIAEIKNKHNTVKGSDQSGLYDTMKNWVMPKSSIYNGYTAYYVTIIPRSPERFNKLFTPSDKEVGARKPDNVKIRIIDGASFYEMVTGDRDALKNLFACLPKVINDLPGYKFDNTAKLKLKSFFEAAYGK